MKMCPQRRVRLLKLATAAAGLIVPLLLLEAGLRIAGYNPLAEPLREGDSARAQLLRVSDNEELVYELVPGAEVSAWGCDIRVNSHGFRDRHYDLEKADGSQRVLAIGDSLTFGNGLPVEFTYPEQLESRFRAAGTQVQVLNLGVGGYDTLQEVALLEDRGLAFSPDYVVVGYCINDVGVVSVNLRYIERVKQYGSPIYHLRIAQLLATRRDRLALDHHVRRENEEATFLDRNRHCIADISDDGPQMARLRRLKDWLAPRGHFPGRRLLEWHTSEPRVGKLRHSFERLKRLADLRGFRVVVVLIPFLNKGPSQRGFRMAHGIVAAEASRLGFDVLDLLEAFRAEGPRSLRLHPDDRLHLNQRGHQIVADHLYRYFTAPEAVTSRESR